MQSQQLGPYRIERSVGRGGMGTVFAAVNLETGQKAAVKILSPALTGNDSFRERFSAEIETLKKLRHPNIVELLGYGEQQGQLFYAMELVHGKSLQEELQEGRRFTWQQVVELTIEICAALKHAHDRGVIHRDLKPANLMLTPDNHTKLSDFGIAKLFGAAQMTADGGVVGTAHYMSPEQAEGGRITARSDLYSLGSVMFALLTRRPPFISKSIPDVIHSLKYDDPPLLTRVAPDAPEELERIVNQLLAKDPAQRIATALALSNRLKALLHATAQAELEATDEDELRLQPESPPVSGAVDATIAATPSQIEQFERHEHATMAAGSQMDYELNLEEPPANSHFTMVSNEERRKVELYASEDESTPLWLKLVMVMAAVAVVGGLLWIGLRPTSANVLYSRIDTAAQGASDDLATVADEMTEFLARFPDDPRAAKVSDVQRRHQLNLMQRRFEIRAGRSDRDNLKPIELAYLRVVQLMKDQPDVALRKLEAFIELYRDDSARSRDAAKCVELARKQRDVLADRVKEMREKATRDLDRKLQLIDDLRESEPQRSAAMCESLLELYGDQPWAAEQVRRARELLGARRFARLALGSATSSGQAGGSATPCIPHRVR